jgi:NADH-quinone oxidoreductase subunit L
LWKLLPITYTAMMVGTIAITGLGIPGIDLGFAGFYSKDAIIMSAFAGGTGPAIAAGLIGMVVAGLTAFYSWRVAFFTFNGHARWGHHAHVAHGHDDHSHAAHSHDEAHADETHDEPLPDDDHGHGHDHKPHESPWTMLVPLILLSVGAAFAGIVFVEYFVGPENADFWRGAIFNAPTNHVLAQREHLAPWVAWSPLVCSIIGLLVAAYMYLWKEGLGAKLAANRDPLYLFFYNKWYFDELYDLTFVRATKALGDIFWKVGDKKIIDGLGPDGVAAAANAIGKRTGKMQSGYVYHYAFVMLLGVLGLVTFAFFAWGRG